MEEIQVVECFFKNYSGRKPDSIEPLLQSGSYRKYYRITSSGQNFIGVYNEDKKENIAFLSFTKTFLEQGLNVPEIYADDIDKNVYLLQYLGEISLNSYLSDKNVNGSFSSESLEMYKKVVEKLPLFQIKGGKSIDYSVCYPRHSFDKQSMMWDLNYFKYYFLKLAKVIFDEQKLETDFHVFTEFLLETNRENFMYRDFQSRNIMIFNDGPYFIDYQGGRRGALQYDIASVLFEAKTSLPADIRELLLDHYLQHLAKQIKIDTKDFYKYYYGYVYIRLMQAMGAYGFRGLYEKKKLFLQSIPQAIEILKWLRKNTKLPVNITEMELVWDRLINSEHIIKLASKILNLTVNINSFSYRRSIPVDETKNGGGFVFDCRLYNNPGKLDEFKNFTGLDKPVIDYLNSDSNVLVFLENIFALIDGTIESYKDKGYTNLMVNFGCTGGQHRSVYSAEKLSLHLKNKFQGIKVVLRHRELEMVANSNKETPAI